MYRLKQSSSVALTEDVCDSWDGNAQLWVFALIDVTATTAVQVKEYGKKV